MRLLNKHEALLSRRVEGYINSSGDYTEGGATSETIRCLVQPQFSKSEFQKDLPEGVQPRDTRVLHTKVLLKTGSERTQTLADIITFKEEEYEVYEVSEWDSGTTRLDHYRAVIIRRDALNGSN